LPAKSLEIIYCATLSLAKGLRFFVPIASGLRMTRGEGLRMTGEGEMRSLGLDVGDRRTGVAVSDPRGILATPLTVLASEDEDALINEILKLVEQYKAECIVVGLPRRLDGELGKQASKVTTFADKLLRRARRDNLSQLDVQLWDERLSTKAAERLKTEAVGQGGKLRSRAKKGAKNHRFSVKAEVDAIAAAFILQGFLDRHHLSNSEGS
jgi:putative Holliday junction resolvase